MRFILIAIFTSLTSSSLVAQPLDWVATYDGPDHLQDFAYDAAIDSQGNVIVAGWIESADEGWDMGVVKFDRRGRFLWASTWAGSGGEDDWASRVVIDSADNIIVSGNVISSGYNLDIAVVKFSADGQRLWEHVYDGPTGSTDWIADGTAMSLDSQDDIVLIGTSYGSSTGSDMVTLKISKSGHRLWERRFHDDSGSSDTGQVVAIDATGSIYAGGSVTRPGGTDVVIQKLDSQGQTLWQSIIDRGDSEWLYDMEIDEAEEVYFVASTESSAGSSDFLTVKLDATGATLWARTYDSPNHSHDIPYALALSPLGGVGVVGVCQQYFAGTTGTICYDDDGNRLWAHHDYGSSWWAGDNGTFDIEFDAVGHAYATGYLYMGPTGGFDAVTYKFAADGTELFRKPYDGPNGGNDQTYGLFIEGRTAIAVGFTTSSDGSPDMLTMKFDIAGGTSSMRSAR